MSMYIKDLLEYLVRIKNLHVKKVGIKLKDDLI